MGAAEVRALPGRGIDVQSHTVSHARLPTLARDAALTELRDSKRALEELLGAPVRAVAYPWGESSAEVERLAAEAGYDAGLIVRRRSNFSTTPIFALRRIGVWSTTSLARLAWDLVRLRWRGD